MGDLGQAAKAAMIFAPELPAAVSVARLGQPDQRLGMHHVPVNAQTLDARSIMRHA
jgi:hypothetical protein